MKDTTKSSVYCKDCVYGHWLDGSQVYFCTKYECNIYRPENCTEGVSKPSENNLPSMIHYVLNILVGDIEPVGDSSIDKSRYNNLCNLLDSLDSLLSDIVKLQKYYDSPADSESRVGKQVRNWMKDTVAYLDDYLTEFDDE